MKKLVFVAAALAMLSVGTSVLAGEPVDKATAKCEKLAKKHHIAEDKMESYMKSCVEKHHQAKAKKAVAPKAEAAPAAAAPAAAAAAPEAAAPAPAAGM